MAVNNPLFVATLAELLERLRLDGVPAAKASTHAIIDSAVLRARATFYRRLGESRVTTLLSIPFVLNPTTEDGVLRALANQVEVDLVFCELMQRLPVAFMDSSGDVNKRWNEEAPVRERGSLDVSSQIKSLKNRIEEDFQMLAGEEGLATEVHLKSFTIEPVETPPRPGDSLRIPSTTVALSEDP